VLSWRARLLKILGYLSTSFVTAMIVLAVAYRFLDSPKEKIMKGDVNNLRDQYEPLQSQIDHLNKAIAELEKRDNNIYRNVFEAAPIPDSVRYGKKYSDLDPRQFSYITPEEMLANIKQGIEILTNRVKTQKNSFDTLEHLVKSKEEMLKSIPAIQPVSDKNLNYIASGFGYRIDPIYKTVKMHTGLDFTAPIGTPIYATGNGVVSTAEYDAGGYGNNVVIDHGYGYETLYGHMSKIKVRVGQKVKRGEVIGWIGNTGKSTGPHCHYEVIRNGQKVDPIHFFFSDLTAAEYERMVHIAAASNQSFD